MDAPLLAETRLRYGAMAAPMRAPYSAKGFGFALALGPSPEPVVRPSWMHFGVGLPQGQKV